MVPAWAFSLGGEKQRGLEAQPLIHNGVIYLTGSYSRMWAVDAKTVKYLNQGGTFWVFKLPKKMAANRLSCLKPSNWALDL